MILLLALKSIFHMNQHLSFIHLSTVLSTVPEAEILNVRSWKEGYFSYWFLDFLLSKFMRVPGIGPESRPWQGRVLPLNHTRSVMSNHLTRLNSCEENIRFLKFLKVFMRLPGFEP